MIGAHPNSQTIGHQNYHHHPIAGKIIIYIHKSKYTFHKTHVGIGSRLCEVESIDS